MTFGLRLTGTVRDVATLHTLAGAAPELVSAPWMEVCAEGARGTAVVTPKIAPAVAEALASRGLDVIRLAAVGTECALEPVRKDGARLVWQNARARNAPTLIEAVRPVRVPGDPAVDDACFLVAPDAPGAHATLERLLLLGRDDVQVAELEGAPGVRWLAVRVPRPPMYLLMRAREEPSEGVRAYARAATNLWVEWGYVHPLAQVASAGLANQKRSALVDAAGEWHTAPGEWPLRSIYDVLVPRLDAPRAELAPSDGASRFTIRLHLGPAPVAVPELWLLSPEQFAGLEALVEGSSPDELARFTTARLAEGSGHVCYLLREIVRPNAPRLGTRVGDLLGVRGFVRVAGTDNLYLPVARRLVPSMRRDELRSLLSLDQSQLVVVDEDADGPRIVSVKAADEVPLARWVEYVATDRRVELDRMLEQSVFDFPELIVQRPVRSKDEGEGDGAARAKAPPPPKAPRKRERAVAPEAPKPAEAENAATESHAADAALREEIRAHEQRVAEGGCDDESAWRILGELKLRAGETDEACACIEAALFHRDEGSAPDGALLAALVRERARRASAKGTPDELVDLAVRAPLAPGEASYLGAAVVERVLRGDRAVDTLVQQVIKVFAEPRVPASRRLAWLVLSSCYRRANDRLGITRAKEAVLGAINDQGLSETHDLPAFVRFSLAIATPGAGGVTERTRADQLAALEQLWWQNAQAHVRPLSGEATDEERVLSCYVQLAFALGFMRLGASSTARDLLARIDEEAPAHKEPNKVLFKLYSARIAHVATEGSAEAWQNEVTNTLGGVKDARLRDRVEWLRRRSEWLRTSAPEAPPPRLGKAVEDLLVDAEQEPSRLGRALADVFALRRRPYDYELNVAIERTLAGALKSGSDDAIGEVLAVAMRGLDSISILGHRARSVGACIRAAATLGDTVAVDRLLDQIITVVQSNDVPSVQDLLLAVGPGLAALRRLGIGPAAARLLEALSQMPRPTERERVALRAALADGFLQVKDEPRASALVDEAIGATLDGQIDYVGRYEGGAAVLAALKHWPTNARVARCARLLDGLDRFKDTFTANQFYETHKVLLLEKLIDALTDDATFRSDRVQGYLDAEEQVIRRRIIADWREACGR